jgi:hypothetical protein
MLTLGAVVGPKLCVTLGTTVVNGSGDDVDLNVDVDVEDKDLVRDVGGGGGGKVVESSLPPFPIVIGSPEGPSQILPSGQQPIFPSDPREQYSLFRQDISTNYQDYWSDISDIHLP